jgi:hypothetical protein
MREVALVIGTMTAINAELAAEKEFQKKVIASELRYGGYRKILNDVADRIDSLTEEAALWKNILTEFETEYGNSGFDDVRVSGFHVFRANAESAGYEVEGVGFYQAAEAFIAATTESAYGGLEPTYAEIDLALAFTGAAGRLKGNSVRIASKAASITRQAISTARVAMTGTGRGLVTKSKTLLRTFRQYLKSRRIAASKPPLPPPQSQNRFSWLGHKNAAMAEEQLARTVHDLPEQAVVRWGDIIGTHGADVISVNIKSGEVTLWDSKFRSGHAKIQPSPTFQNQATLTNAIREAEETIRANTTLPSGIRQKALENLAERRVTTRTVGAGNAKNSRLE